MKLIIAALAMTSTAAFVPSTPKPFVGMSPSSLYSTVDDTGAIQAAIEASKKFGATSTEAKLAWEAVEEMDENDITDATKGRVMDKEYEEKVTALSALLEDQKEKVQAARNLAEEIKAIRLREPSEGYAGLPGPAAELQDAIKAAKKAEGTSGVDSPEARLAWETVEEIASSDVSDIARKSLDEECLIDFIEGCEAIEELSRVIGDSDDASP